MKKALIVLVTVMMTVTLFISCGNDPFFHYVEFDSNGGTAVERQIVRNGEKATEPKDPTKDGTEFVAWYDGENVFDFNTEITKDYKLTAKWADGSGSNPGESTSSSHTVTFVLNGGTGSGCETQTIEAGGKATKPATDPKLTNAVFKFWSADGNNAFDFDTVITKNTTLTAVWKTTFQVGDKGPAGGYIFYDCDADNTPAGAPGADGLTSSSCGWRYLEAAPSDASSTYIWGPDTEGTSYGTETGIGKGKSNTEKVLALTGDFEAFKACADYGNDKDYDDWFLPSKDELNLIYTELKAKNIGTWANDRYWSSSEEDSWSSRYSQDFETGAQEDWGGAQNPSHVRPVRAFTEVTSSSGTSGSESENADFFLEAFNAADFVMNDFVHGVFNYEERDTAGGGSYPMNYYYSATEKSSYSTDPLMKSDGSKFLNLFTNEAKTKRVGISKFTNYSEYDSDNKGTVNGSVSQALLKAAANGINLEFKYKDQTSSDNGTTWTDSGDEKAGYFICNAVRTKEAVEGSTTKFKYTVTDLKLSVKTFDGSFIDVSSNNTVSYESISYVINGSDLSTLSDLTYDGTALTADETAAVIAALTD